MAVSPASVSAGQQHRTLAFTFTAAAGGTSGGSLSLTVPAGWSAPSVTNTAAGYVKSSAGSVTVTNRTITVSGITVSASHTVVITYGAKTFGGPGATAPPTAVGKQTWHAKAASTVAGTLTSLTTSPFVTVS